MAPRGNQFATLEVTENDYLLARELDIRITCHAGDGEWGKGRPIAQLARSAAARYETRPTCTATRWPTTS